MPAKTPVNDPEAMALATADASGQPSVRMVLLKGHGPDGFVFYTNEQSAKGKQKGQWGSQTAVFALMWLLHNIIPFQVT